MNHQHIILSFLLMMIGILSYGQENIEDIVSNKRLNIQSENLEEERTIEIYLPPSYAASKERKYPVMYIMDGQEYFLHPIAYQRMLRFKEKSPEFIVVGIDSDRKKRRRFYYQDAEKYIKFLENELIPLIDKNYRTLKQDERLYFGWEMAGGLGLEIFNQNSSLFSAYFLSSSTHITEGRLMNADSICKNESLNKTFFYFTHAPEEKGLKIELQKLDSIFSAHEPKNISWKHAPISGDDHYTTPTKTIHDGLRTYFDDYNPLRFLSLKGYDEFGDFEAIKKYYEHRGKRYHVSSEIHRTTRHFLLYHSMRDDNFERFEFYAQEFQDHLYDMRLDIWVNRFAKYFEENNREEKALKIYKAGSKKFPESASIYNGMGNLYKKKKNKQNAAFYYKKAIQAAEKNKDAKLDEYKKNLNEL